jgi:hypothetical protein
MSQQDDPIKITAGSSEYIDHVRYTTQIATAKLAGDTISFITKTPEIKGAPVLYTLRYGNEEGQMAQDPAPIEKGRDRLAAFGTPMLPVVWEHIQSYVRGEDTNINPLAEAAQQYWTANERVHIADANLTYGKNANIGPGPEEPLLGKPSVASDYTRHPRPLGADPWGVKLSKLGPKSEEPHPEDLPPGHATDHGLPPAASKPKVTGADVKQH